MSRAMYWSEVAMVAAIGAIALVVFLWALYCAIWAWMERRIAWHNRQARRVEIALYEQEGYGSRHDHVVGNVWMGANHANK